MTIGSLFSGIAGLEAGLESLGLGPVLWQCDSDPAARRVLAARYPGVRCYEDVRQIDGSAARVQLVCGGFPCQPHSTAGKRKGTKDPRWLWPEFARVIEAVRPQAVFIENVPGLRSSGLSEVLADLADLGFDAEWDLFRASDVGAPHRRTRLFVLAHANGDPLGLQPRRGGGARGEGEAIALHDGGAGLVGSVAHAVGQGELQPGRGERSQRRRAGHGGGPALPHAHGERLAGRSDDEAAAGPPGGDAAQGSHAWAVEPDVGRVAHGVPARAHRLRLLGNSCVPQQAALAFQVLSERAVS